MFKRFGFLAPDRSSGCPFVCPYIRPSVEDKVLILLISGSYLQADLRPLG